MIFLNIKVRSKEKMFNPHDSSSTLSSKTFARGKNRRHSPVC